MKNLEQTRMTVLCPNAAEAREGQTGLRPKWRASYETEGKGGLE